MLFSNATGVLDEFPLSPISNPVLMGLGWYMSMLMTSVVCVNCLLLLTFLGTRDLRQPINTFVIAITLINFFGALIEFPFVIAANFARRWIWGHVGCAISGYSTYFVGCASIYMMVAISIERFYTIYNPMSMKKMTYKKSMLGVQICLILGAFWPTMPLLGWSHYALEGGLTSCSVTWNEQSTNVISYNLAIFVFVYILPVVVIIATNAKMLLILKKMPKIGNSAEDPKIQKRIDMEKRVTRVMMGYITLFVVSWTPYAVAALWSAFIDPGHVAPLAATLPAFIAKSSMLWSSLFFIFSNKKVKRRLAMGRDTTIASKSQMENSSVNTANKTGVASAAQEGATSTV